MAEASAIPWKQRYGRLARPLLGAPLVMTRRARAFWVWAWVLFIAACSGETLTSSGTGNGTGDTGPWGWGWCVDIDVSTYDTSCKVDSDCIDVTPGVICQDESGCLCGGGGAINVDGQAQYQAAISAVSPSRGPVCECPVFGAARCVQGQCVYCPVDFSADAGDGPLPLKCPGGGG